MKGCPISQGKIELINVLITLHKQKQEITLNRIYMEMKSIRTNDINEWIKDLEVKKFVEFNYNKSLRKTILVTDKLYMLHKLITLTNLLIYGNPEFYQYALPTLRGICKFLKKEAKT
jgi:hypothetical protein